MFEIELEFAVADGKQKRSPNADECIPEELLEGRHFLLVEDNADQFRNSGRTSSDVGSNLCFEGEWVAGSRGV